MPGFMRSTTAAAGRTPGHWGTRMIGSGVVAIAAIPAVAGPLDPPAGAINPTGRFGPRIEVNPQNTPGDADSVFRIDQPGSYYLAEGVTGEALKHGIEVASADVTLDLNGFAIEGVIDALDGVHIELNGFMLNIVVRNGSINQWPLDGVNADDAVGIILEDLSFFLCQGLSIRAGGAARIARCHTVGSNGFQGLESCVVQQCRVIGTLSGNGFGFGANSNMSHCVAADCDQAGFTIESGTITGCVANGNGNGILASSGSSVVACAAFENDFFGFSGIGCTFSQCHAEQNGAIGFNANRCSLSACSAVRNDTRGFFLQQSFAEACLAIQNMNAGFDLSDGGSVLHCTALDNGSAGVFPGIHAQSESHIVGNFSAGNSGPGIELEGRESLIDSNNVANNGIGIRITMDRNLVIRNVARDNGGVDYDIIAGNRVGIISVPPLSGTISTLADPDALGTGTTDPWANFSY